MTTATVAILVPNSVKAIVEKAASGEKFEVEDITVELAEIAKAYLRTYTGDFEYLRNVQYDLGLRGSLSIGQVKGTLNCMVADARRNPAPEPEADPEVVGFWHRPLNVKPGYFTVVLKDGSHRTLRIQRGKIGPNAKEKFFIGFLNGPVNTLDYVRCAVVFRGQLTWIRPYGTDNGPLTVAVRYLITMTDAQKREAGVLYAVESNNCFNCGAVLTEPESIEAHLGPICRGKWGA